MKKLKLKYIFGKNIDLYALILTLWAMGVILHFDFICISSKMITTVIECICLFFSCILLVNQGTKLKKKGILGIKEMAYGATELYIMSFCVPINDYISFVWFLSVAFYLFNFIGGLISFFNSLIEQWSSTDCNALSKIENTVAIITSILITIFSGIQLFI